MGHTTSKTTRALELDDAVIAYDVREASGATDHPVLLIIGQPMCADGFEALADVMPERTVVTYDPRGLGRSTRSDGSTANDPRIQARDLHALIAEVGGGQPVDVFGSSGGAIAGLALVEAHPDDVRVLVAHEPPIFDLLPDAEFANAASERVDATYAERGFGAGLATFIQLVSHQGEFTAEFLEQPLPDPAQFGLPTEDDGSRDDPLMGGSSRPVTEYAPDIERLQAAPTRIVVGIGETSGEIVTARTSRALAEQLDCELATFRGGHGGFAADEWGTPGDPPRFAQQLRDVLDR